MASETFITRFFWGSRKECLTQCAARLHSFLSGLAELDSVFSQWCSPGPPPGQPIDITRRQLDELVQQGVHRMSIRPYMPISELGSSVTLLTTGNWTLTLAVHCGCHAEGVPNSVILDLPASGAAARRILRVDFLVPLCQLIVECWDPDAGQVWSPCLSETLGIPDEGEIEVGWLTYVSNHHREVPTFDNKIEAIPVGTSGTLIIATRQRFSSERTAHVEQARTIVEALNASP